MKKVAALLALALAAVALVACGDDEGTTTATTETGNAAAEGGAAGGGGEAGGAAAEGGGAGTALKFEADPGGGIAYTSDAETAEAGKVTVEFNNPQAVPHDVAIEDPSGKQVGKTDVVTESNASTTVDLKSGEYKFFCTIPGHRDAGMEGTLTVK
jgi:plastocyanin